MTKDFSDAPLTVNGITVKPAWRWSKQHRADVAEDMRQADGSSLSEHDKQQRYVEWYAAKNGLSFAEARRRVEAML